MRPRTLGRSICVSADSSCKLPKSSGPMRTGLRRAGVASAPLRARPCALDDGHFSGICGHISSVLGAHNGSGMTCTAQVRTACRVGPHAVQTSCRWSEDRLPGDLGCSPGNRKERLDGRTRMGPWLGPRLGPWLGPRLVIASRWLQEGDGRCCAPAVVVSQGLARPRRRRVGRRARP